MSSTQLTDIEQTTTEVRECAQQVQESSLKKRRAYARKRVVGWTLTFGWMFFMLVGGMSLSEVYNGWVFFGGAMLGLVLMIWRHHSIGKNAQRVYEELCLQPLFSTLGDWVHYFPKQGIPAEIMKASWRGEELLVLLDDQSQNRPKSHFLDVTNSGIAAEMFGHHLVKGELLGRDFCIAQVPFDTVVRTERHVGQIEIQYDTTTRSVLIAELTSKAAAPIYILPNLANIAEGMKKMLKVVSFLATMKGSSEDSTLYKNRIPFPDDETFDQTFVVLSEEQDLAKEVVTAEVRAALLELAPHFGFRWPALCIVGQKMMALEADAHLLFAQAHPDRINLESLAENWLVVLCEVMMLASAVDDALAESQE